jgi:TnpA family transposase
MAALRPTRRGDLGLEHDLHHRHPRGLGLFRMLGYRFSPRIADLSDQRFWRADPIGGPAGDYGPLNAIARDKVNLERIRTHWPDMLRVAGSLLTNTCAPMT